MRGTSTVAGRTAILALLLLGQGTGVVRASKARSSAHRSTKASVVQRCKQRDRASGTVTAAYGPGADVVGLSFLVREEKLLSYDDKGRLFPEMATKIPTRADGGVRDGGKTVVITLKKGLRWSDGAEITSADVRFGWQMARDPENAPDQNCPWCTLISRIDTPDRYTAVFRLPRASPTLLYWLAQQFQPWPVVWPHWWNHDSHKAALALNVDPNWTWIGSQYPTDGPYYLASATDTEAVLHPMQYYSTMSCGARIQTFKIQSYPSVAALLTAAATHKVEMTPAPGFGIVDLPELKRHAAAFVTHLDPSYFIEQLNLNADSTYLGQPNPLHDVRVRLALALALDKVHLLERALLLDQHEASRNIAWTPWVNTPKLVQEGADRSISGQWDPLVKKYVADTGKGQALADARKLLSETRWKRGFTLDFDTTPNNPVRQAEEEGIAADWGRLGVRVTSHFLTSAVLNETYAQGGPLAHGLFQVVMFALASEEPDLFATALESKYRTRGVGTDPSNSLNGNFGGIHDPVIDRAFEAATRTFNTAARNRSFAEIQQRLNQHAYWIMLFPHPDLWTDDRRIQNVSDAASYGTALWNAYAWKLRGG